MIGSDHLYKRRMSEISKRKNIVFNTLVLLFLTFCVQFTDLKIGFVKITELLLLVLAPIVLLNKLNKYIVHFLLFFTTMALLSLWTTSRLEFSYIEPSFFKRPYWITISRYLEIITCLVLCSIAFQYFKSLKKNNEFHYYIKIFIDLNLGLTAVFVFVYLLVVFNIISIDDTRLVYSYATRLRGYYAEGGPLGLMLSFFFIITKYLRSKKAIYLRRIFLFIVISFMAQSKAGILCCVVWLGIENFEFATKKLKAIFIPIVVISLIGFTYLFININSMYVKEFDRVRQAVLERPKDRNLILGRVSGFFIAPKLIGEHPMLGIGTGNYPLLRNNKEFRGFFPLPPKKIRNIDAHGYGGIMDILVDNGLLGILLFFFILLKVLVKVRREKGKIEFLIAFVILFSFGVQIHFMYPWILLALILVKNNDKDEVDRRLEVNS